MLWQRFALAALIFGMPLASSAQDHMEIHGQIKDRKTGQGIPFVTISICEKALGTSSNEDGEFRLILPFSFQKDSICVSSIGYYQQKFAITDEVLTTFQQWSLAPHVENLREIVISDEKLPDPYKLITKGIQKISKNYASDPYLLEGYYRDYLVDGKEYQNLLEAAIGIFDGGFQTADIWTRVKIYQSRYSKGNPINYNEIYENNLGGRSGHLNIFGGNTISVLRYNNPIRNYRRSDSPTTGYELDDSFTRYHDLELNHISYLNDEKIYVVSVVANARHPQFRNLRLAKRKEEYTLNGRVYIRAEDFSILRFEYKIYDVTKQRTLNQLRLEYKEHNKKMYLNYISFANFITLKRDFHEDEFMHYRELFVNSIRLKDLPSKNEFYLFSKIQQIHKQTYLTDPDFWEKYNMVLRKEFEP